IRGRNVTGVQTCALPISSFPAFITLGERFVFKEHISRQEWTILGLVTLGLLLVTPSFDFANQATTGLAWAVASGLSFALFTLIKIGRAAWRERGWTKTAE